MELRSFLKATLFCVGLLTAIRASAQGQAIAKPAPSPVDVVYTGRLFGYFRVPSLQKYSETNGCPNYDQDLANSAAKQFLRLRDKQDPNRTILVGTGDNFAPELVPRVFDEPPASNRYAVGNKELYVGARDHLGVYNAIVPGKHDFYFGAERVREFARFLAAPQSGDYEPVQMLEANLVMRTVPIEDSAVSAKSKADRDFGDWPTDYPVLNLKNGKSVYPWFSVIKIQLADIPPESRFSNALKKLMEKFVTTDGIVLTKNLGDVQKFFSDTSETLNQDLQTCKSGAPIAY